MKRVPDARSIAKVTRSQRGVFSTTDLQTLLAEPHPTGFARRIRVLEHDGVLRRFCRGFYVSETFDLPTLCQRIAPDSYVSFGTVLARELVIGTRPERQVIAARTGKSRVYSGLGFEVVHVHIATHLDFGHSAIDGVQTADIEKAVLDVLYFHLRGRRFPFDVYSDIAFDKLDRRRLAEYLDRYRNPKFVAFVNKLLELP